MTAFSEGGPRVWEPFQKAFYVHERLFRSMSAFLEAWEQIVSHKICLRYKNNGSKVHEVYPSSLTWLQTRLELSDINFQKCAKRSRSFFCESQYLVKVALSSICSIGLVHDI